MYICSVKKQGNMTKKLSKQLELFASREIEKREAKIEKLKEEIDYYKKELDALLEREYKPNSNNN